MNRLYVRIIFTVLTLILWMTVVIVALELLPRWWWRKVETNNPFIAARVQELPWPAPDAPPNKFSPMFYDVDVRARYRGRGKSNEPLPLPTAEEEMVWRAPYFHAYEDLDRYFFAGVYSMRVMMLRASGALSFVYSGPHHVLGSDLTEFLPEDDAPRIRDGINRLLSGAANHVLVDRAQPLPKVPFGYFLLPVHENDVQAPTTPHVWLLYPDAAFWRSDNTTSLWELPFVIYRKHAERRNHIGLLGESEDYRINNYGFRDWDIITPKPEGTFRMLCIGASTTEEGIINALTYPALLETLLNMRFDDNFVDVVNCGVSGMNAMKHRARMPDYLALEPDMLVVYNAVNDICHILMRRWIDYAGSARKILRESRFITLYMNRLLLPSDDEIRADIEEFNLSHLRRITREAARQGIPVAVCSFAAPDQQALSRDAYDYYNYQTMQEWGGRYITFDSYLHALALYNAALAQFCRDENVMYIPVAEKLRGGAEIFGDICHLRNPGIQKKAEIIAEAVFPLIEEASGKR